MGTAAGRVLMPRECRRILFSGRVQGVGFRFKCQSLARRFELAGYVRNLADGRVELVADGESAEIDAYLKAVQAEMDPYIANVVTEPDLPHDDRLTGFSIRY